VIGGSKAPPHLRADFPLVRATKTGVHRTKQAFAMSGPALMLLRSGMGARPTELWVGDSHVLFMNGRRPGGTRLTKISSRKFVWHVGPRLMWSIANTGFPPEVLLMAQLIRRFGGSRNLTLVVVFGEIDVRAHLAKRQARSRPGMKFVDEYLRQCQLLGKTLHAQRIVITVPVPPGDSLRDAPEFPRSGSLPERINAFRLLRAELEESVDTSGRESDVVLLDCTEEIADSQGSLRVDLTDDGCHVNDSGVSAIQASLKALLR
jgi:hypothetical protein